MTKYVLHGGETFVELDENPEFFKVLTDSPKNPLNILLVYFGRPEYQWLDLSQEDKGHFNTASNKSLNFKLASMKHFTEELQWADIIFIKGGDGPKLTNILSKYPNFKNILKGKMIGAISAGVNALSSYYYSIHGQRILKGLGILPLKVFTHYHEGLEPELKQLKQWGEKMRTEKIPEGAFIIYEDNS